MVKATTRSFKELRTDDNFQKVWDKSAVVSENKGFSESTNTINKISFIQIRWW
jgi:hypothetical protein